MNKNGKKNILLLFGGMGAEHEVSVKSAEALFDELTQLGYNVIATYIDRCGAWHAPDCPTSPEKIFDRRAAVREVSPKRLGGAVGIATNEGFTEIHCAIPALHGDFGEDGCIQGALTSAGLPFVGCNVGCGAICADKSVCKLVADLLGIKTVESVTVYGSLENAKSAITAALPFPIFIKPTGLGSSLGAACADNEEELDTALSSALSLSRCVLAEKFIKGARELECAFFEYKSKQYFTRVGEIRHNGRFYGYGEKYSSVATELICPSDIPSEIEEKIRSAARLLVARLGIKHLSRLDFFLSEDGELYFNEINTMPGLTEASMFPLLVRHEGVSLGEIFSDFIENL